MRGTQARKGQPLKKEGRKDRALETSSAGCDSALRGSVLRKIKNPSHQTHGPPFPEHAWCWHKTNCQVSTHSIRPQFLMQGVCVLSGSPGFRGVGVVGGTTRSQHPSHSVEQPADGPRSRVEAQTPSQTCARTSRSGRVTSSSVPLKRADIHLSLRIETC